MADWNKYVISISTIILLVLLFPLSVNAVQMSSSNYQMYSFVVDSAGDNISSDNHQTNFVLGTITGNIISAAYNMFLGFWYASNLIPELVSHTFSPDPLFTANNLISTIEWSDNESDILSLVEFKWYVNNVHVYTGTHLNVLQGANATSTLPETYFDDLDLVTVSIRLNDSSSVTYYYNYSITVSTTDPSGPATGGSGGGGGGGGGAGGSSYNPLSYNIIPRTMEVFIVPLDKRIIGFKIQNYENESLFVDIGIKGFHEIKQVEDIDIYEIQSQTNKTIELEVTGGAKTNVTKEFEVDVHLVERHKTTMDVFKIKLITVGCYALGTYTDNPAKCCSGLLQEERCISRMELRQSAPNWKNIIFATITSIIFIAILIVALFYEKLTKKPEDLEEEIE